MRAGKPRPVDPTLDDMWFTGLANHLFRSGYSASTVSSYIRSAELLQEWAIESGRPRAEDVDSEMVHQWLSDQRAQFSGSTVAVRSCAVRVLQDYWRIRGWHTDQNPDFERIEFIRPTQQPTLTNEELLAVRYASSQLGDTTAYRLRNAALLGVLIDAGRLRVSDIRLMTIDDVEWGDANIHPSSVIAGNRLPAACFIGRENRQTPLSIETGMTLARYLFRKSGWEAIRYRSTSRRRYLWPIKSHRSGEHPISRSAIYNLVRRVGEQAEISRPISPDLLRRRPK